MLKKITDFLTGFRDNLQPHVCLFYLSSLLAPEMEIHRTLCILNIDWKETQFCLCWWEILSWTSKENCLLSGLPHFSKESLKLSLSHFSKSLVFYIFPCIPLFMPLLFSPSPSPQSLISPFIILLWTFFFFLQIGLLKRKKVKITYFVLIKIQVLW